MKMREAVAAAMLAAAQVEDLPAHAQKPTIEEVDKDKKVKEEEDKKRREEIKPAPDVPYAYTGPLFRIDEYINATEGSSEERQKLVKELIEEITGTTIVQKEKDSQGNESSFWRKTYPLITDGKMLEVIVSLYPDHNLFAIAVVDLSRSEDMAIVLRDEGMTGTPNGHQLPIQLQGKSIPQGFAIFSEDSIATKLYYGLLKHVLSKY